MKKTPCVILILLSTGISACTVGYQARGSLSDQAGELRGQGYPAISGGGRFVLHDSTGTLRCEGEASPPKRSPNPGSCLGEGGDGLVRCTDGREIILQWEAISCRSWQGRGVDGSGNRLEFRVDRK